MAKSIKAATAPFQYAMSTKAGCECVVHILQTITDQDSQATVLSIDGIDLISRSAMLEGLLKMDRGDEIFPFVRCFYCSPPTDLWEDEMGMSHEIAQGEGGEQGDPLMPMLFALGLHPALRAAQARMRAGENSRLLVKECKVFIDRTTKRITKLKAELDAETVLLQESRARLLRLEAQEAATPPTLVDTGRCAQVVNLQQMVNQLQAERDVLSQELRRSRAPKDKTSWAGDAPPDVSSIPLVPDDHQAIEEWMTVEIRSAERPRVWNCGRDLARVQHVGAGSCQIGTTEGCICSAAHGGSISWQSHGCPHRRSRRSNIEEIVSTGVVGGVRPDTACVASVWVRLQTQAQ